MSKRFHSCPWCKSEDIHTVWPETQWDQCYSCSLFFRNPMPTKEELDDLYSESWSRPEEATTETGGTDEQLAKVYARKLAKSLKREDFRGLRILDFGAGRGAMLRALREMGADACGVEPYGMEYLQAQGFEVYQDLSEIEGTFDGIVTVDVVEHLHRPWATVRDLYNTLCKDGWLYVATCNPSGLNARITRGNWREAKKPGHLIWPTPRLMEEFLKSAGFKEVKRLRWLVRYSNNLLKRAFHAVTQLTGQDGELRYLALK